MFSFLCDNTYEGRGNYNGRPWFCEDLVPIAVKEVGSCERLDTFLLKMYSVSDNKYQSLDSFLVSTYVVCERLSVMQ